MGSPLGDFRESGPAVDSKVAALTGGTAASSAVTAQSTTVTMRTALLHGETLQEAQVHSGEKWTLLSHTPQRWLTESAG